MQDLGAESFARRKKEMRTLPHSFVQTARRHPDEVKSMALLSGGTNAAGRQFLRSGSPPPALFVVADDDEFRPTLDVMN